MVMGKSVPIWHFSPLTPLFGAVCQVSTGTMGDGMRNKVPTSECAACCLPTGGGLER